MLPSFLTSSGSFTTDLVLIAIVFALFFFYGMYFGKARLISLISAFYPAAFFYEHFPFLNSFLILKGNLLVLNKALIFLFFLIVLDIAIGRFIFSDSGYGSARILRTIGFSLAVTALVLVAVHSFVDIKPIYSFSPALNALFSTPAKLFWWSVAPIGLLLVL